MADYPYVPGWVDRRTAEWCAQICDHVAARLIRVSGEPERLIGAELCAGVIRAMVAAGKPALPDIARPGVEPSGEHG